MPFHVHDAPQCSFWTSHDPSCFAEGLGAEVDCVQIEVGKNKGKYVCIHRAPPETGSGRGGFARHSRRRNPHPEIDDLDQALLVEYVSIMRLLTDGARPAIGSTLPTELPLGNVDDGS